MKYNVGDRVRIKNFDWFRNEGSNMVVAYMTKYYGEIVTIKSVHKGFYRIKEDGGQYCWIDEMFECKVEEKIKPKFKMGDKVKDKNNRVWFIVRMGETFFDISSIPNGSDGAEVSGYFVPMEDQDDYELFPDRELPKTFEECVSVLEGENRMSLELMNTFRKLIDARNAYWKIYGEENGLGKPWEPDWKNVKQKKYCIYNEGSNIKKNVLYSANSILAFPTPEMRDAFYEAFRKEIEICKELL